MTTASKTPAKASVYENNPFFVAINGLELLFKKAQAIGILLAVVAGLSVLSSPSSFIPPSSQSNSDSGPLSAKDQQQFTEWFTSVPTETWFLIAGGALFVLLLIITIGVIIRGIMDYTSAQIAHDNDVTISEAFRAVFANFWGYTWVLLIVGVKTFLWTLLLIIPGIIMSVRYSLAGVAYFDKKLPGNGSVKESTRLTKNAWLTTFASQSLFNIVTLGLVEQLLVPGTQAILYRQYKSFDVAGTPKPSAHVLSWLTLMIPVALLGFIVLGLVLLFGLSTAQ